MSIVMIRAMVMATPPRRGMGVACRSRLRSWGTMPHLRHTKRTSGVTSRVSAIATHMSSR